MLDEQQLTLKLDVEAGAALSGLIDLAQRSGNPMEKLAAQIVGEAMRDAVLEALPPEAAIAAIDEVVEQAEREGVEIPEQARERLAELRCRVEKRDEITEAEAESIDVDGTIERIFAEAEKKRRRA